MHFTKNCYTQVLQFSKYHAARKEAFSRLNVDNWEGDGGKQGELSARKIRIEGFVYS